MCRGQLPGQRPSAKWCPRGKPATARHVGIGSDFDGGFGADQVNLTVAPNGIPLSGTVRAFATGEVSQEREASVLGTEVLVGLLIGVLCGAATMAVAGFMEGGGRDALEFGAMGRDHGRSGVEQILPDSPGDAAAPDPLGALEDDRLDARSSERPGGGQACDPGTHDRDLHSPTSCRLCAIG